MGAMASQLVLIEATDADWRFDDHTKEVGRRGLEQARQALAAAVTRRARAEAQVSRAA